VSTPFIARHVSTASAFVFEITLQSSVPGTVQIFYDIGSGIREKDSARVEVARSNAGYSEAMSIVGSRTEVRWALGVLALAGGLIGLTCFAKAEKFTQFVIGGIVSAELFLAWKEGFVRHDTHANLFFSLAVLTPFLLIHPPALGGVYKGASGIVTYAVISWLASSVSSSSGGNGTTVPPTSLGSGIIGSWTMSWHWDHSSAGDDQIGFHSQPSNSDVR
jgi:hypothetical protein